MHSTRLSDLATLAIAACCVVLTGSHFLRPRIDGAATVSAQRLEEVPNWERFSTGGHSVGSPAAPIKVVEFTDIQCPFCKRLQATLRDVRRERGSVVEIVYHHFPLAMHQHALVAAIAADCAASQLRFDQMVEALFEAQDSLGLVSWARIAARAGVPDTSAFVSCLKDERARARVKNDQDMGKELNISGTPTVLVNRWRIHGTPSKALLDSLIDVELKAVRKVRS